MLTADCLVTFSGVGGSQNTWLSLSQIRELNLGHNDKPDYFSTKGFISFFKKENCLYQVSGRNSC